MSSTVRRAPTKKSKKAQPPALDFLRDRYDELVPAAEKHRRDAEWQAGVRLAKQHGHGMVWQGYGECYKCGAGATVQLVTDHGWVVTGEATTKKCTG